MKGGRNQQFEQQKKTIDFTKNIKEKKPKQFGAGLFMDDDEEEEEEDSHKEEEDQLAQVIQSKKGKHQQNFSMGGQEESEKLEFQSKQQRQTTKDTSFGQ